MRAGQHSSSTPSTLSPESGQTDLVARRWVWALLLTGIAVLLAYVNYLILRRHNPVLSAGFSFILLLNITLVLTVAVLFYHFVASWAQLTARSKAVYVLALLVVSAFTFAIGYNPNGWVAFLVVIPAVAAPFLLYTLFPRSGKAQWGRMRTFGLFFLFGVVILMGGCAARPITLGF
jgi:hypothetical protein